MTWRVSFSVSQVFCLDSSCISWPVSEVCRNWPTESLTRCFSGCIIKRFSACAPVLPLEDNSLGGPPLFNVARTGNQTRFKAQYIIHASPLCHGCYPLLFLHREEYSLDKEILSLGSQRFGGTTRYDPRPPTQQRPTERLYTHRFVRGLNFRWGCATRMEMIRLPIQPKSYYAGSVNQLVQLPLTLNQFMHKSGSSWITWSSSTPEELAWFLHDSADGPAWSPIIALFCPEWIYSMLLLEKAFILPGSSSIIKSRRVETEILFYPGLT